MQTFILADNQDITSAGVRFILQKTNFSGEIIEVTHKKELLTQLSFHANAVILLDYTLFDLGGIEELMIIKERYKETHWILFCDELSNDFLKRLLIENSFTVLLKHCALYEIETGIRCALKKEFFICHEITGMLLQRHTAELKKETTVLTPTEQQILKFIAMGKSTKEIASERYSSIHTIITHKKNIFRKLEVNNVYEATKYAFRAGLIDSAEYYI